MGHLSYQISGCLREQQMTFSSLLWSQRFKSGSSFLLSLELFRVRDTERRQTLERTDRADAPREMKLRFNYTNQLRKMSCTWRGRCADVWRCSVGQSLNLPYPRDDLTACLCIVNNETMRRTLHDVQLGCRNGSSHFLSSCHWNLAIVASMHNQRR